MGFKQIDRTELAASRRWREAFGFALALLFIVAIAHYTALLDVRSGGLLVAAAVLGGYMAINIGANDVANNVGPAIGAGVLPLRQAVLIAALCEAAGAIVGGDEMVQIVRGGIIEPAGIAPAEFVRVMLAALLAAAISVNAATVCALPVSTTHALVGAILGAGIAAAGVDIVYWERMGGLAASWALPPLFGTLCTAAFLYLIERRIVDREDSVSAAVRLVPVLVGLMVAALGFYLLLKGFQRIRTIGWPMALAGGFGAGLLAAALLHRRLQARREGIANDENGLNALFAGPLLGAVAVLSFAHGATDVANVIAPVAAVAEVLTGADVGLKQTAAVPAWLLLLGAIGIAMGAGLFGARVIRVIATEISELDPMRAYCVAMASILAVIVASLTGLPISSTHVAVGGVLGVGFLRERLQARQSRRELALGPLAVEKPDFRPSAHDESEARCRRVELVKRTQFFRIATAWVVTIPAAALLAVLLYQAMRSLSS